jgi:quinol monooxygenase YgiN
MNHALIAAIRAVEAAWIAADTHALLDAGEALHNAMHDAAEGCHVMVALRLDTIEAVKRVSETWTHPDAETACELMIRDLGFEAKP